MIVKSRELLIKDVQASQRELSDLLLSVAEDQDWQPEPGEWSFRYIAGHMATVDKDAFLPRVSKIAAGINPHFEYYLNDDFNFGNLDLRYYIKEWATIRKVMVDFVSALPEEALSLTGTHARFGTLTVLDVLQIVLDHDREHIEHLKQLFIQYKS
ncbi:MAG: DinB family protein [Ardenticatenaceae bacterium]